MKNEYGVELRMQGLPYSHLIRIKEYPGKMEDISQTKEEVMAEIMASMGTEAKPSLNNSAEDAAIPPSENQKQNSEESNIRI